MACAPELTDRKRLRYEIRNEITSIRAITPTAAALAAWAAEARNRYWLAQGMHDQAVRDLSAAYRDFWRADAGEPRRRALVWIRRLNARERFHSAHVHLTHQNMVQAQRAARECV
jgi:hypothetical protein